MKSTRNIALTLLLIVPAILLLVGVLVVPLTEIVGASFYRANMGIIGDEFSFDNYRQILTSLLYWEIFLKTIGSALLVTFLCAVFGYPIAAHLVRAPARYQPILFFLVAAPLLVNTVVRTYGWLLILGQVGVVNVVLNQLGLTDGPLRLTSNYFGMIIGSVQVFMPFMILSIATSMRGIDRHVLQAADILGATPAHRLRTIELPLIAPGLIAGAVLVFGLMLGAFVTPLMLGGTAIKYLSVSVYMDSMVTFNLPRAIALSMVLLFVVSLAYTIQAALTKKYSQVHA